MDEKQDNLQEVNLSAGNLPADKPLDVEITAFQRIEKGNYKVFKICMVFLIAVSALAVGVASYLRLSEPVFVQSYSDYEVSEEELLEFQLAYFSNIDEKTEVVGISFAEAPELDFWLTEYSESIVNGTYGEIVMPPPNKPCGRHNLQTIAVTLPDAEQRNRLEEVALSYATVRYSDGSTQKVDIGKIVLFQKEERFQTDSLFTIESSEEKVDETTTRVVSELFSWDGKKLTLTAVESSFLGQGEDPYELNLDGEDYTKAIGKTYTGQLEVSASFSNAGSKGADFTVFEPVHRLIFQDEAGTKYVYKTGELKRSADWLYPEFGSAIAYLRGRGAI